MLKGRKMSPDTLDVLREFAPARQIEVARFMKSAANYSISFAMAFLATTKISELATPDCMRKMKGLTSAQKNRMAREMEPLQRHFKEIEGSYGADMLGLAIASGYVARLIDNKTIRRFLVQHYPEILEELSATVRPCGMRLDLVAEKSPATAHRNR